MTSLEKGKVLKGVVKYGPTGKTYSWQPVDSEFGRLIKSLTISAQQDWLGGQQTWTYWLGQCEKFTAKKGILITHRVGGAS